MISEQFEKLICQGKAEHHIFNIGEGITNYNIGRGKNCIIESISFHPFILFNGLVADPTKLLTDLYARVGIMTLYAYDNSNSKAISVKNKFAIAGGGHSNDLGYTGSSILDFQKDVFWLFSGENITFEIPEILNTITQLHANNVNPINLPTKENQNPNGYTNPTIAAVSYSGGVFSWNVNLMGRQSGVNLPGITYNDFILPRNGDGINGNSIKKGVGATANQDQPIINIGLIEYNPNDLI